jgi:hypothetical protein
MEENEQPGHSTRRDLIIKAGVAGAVAWTAPVVLSQSAQAATSGTPPTSSEPPPPPGCTSFSDFADVSSLTFVSNTAGVPTVTAADHLELTNLTGFIASAAWLTAKQTVAGGFSSDYTFQINGDADGFAFVIQNQGLGALGTSAEGLGYSTILSSLAVECDIFDNGAPFDPNGNHVAVHSNGTGLNTSDGAGPLIINQTNASLPLTLKDDAPHQMHVGYDGTTMTVAIDGTTLLSFAVDLGTLLGLSDGMAFVGFTAATGGALAFFDILNWTFCPSST